jgi:hypothetical protein
MIIPREYKEVKVVGPGKNLCQRVHFSAEKLGDKHTQALWRFFKILGNSPTLLGLNIEIKVTPISERGK